LEAYYLTSQQHLNIISRSFHGRIKFFVCIKIVRGRPAALYDLSDPNYKDALKQLSWCAEWVAVIWKKLTRGLIEIDATDSFHMK